MGSFQNVEEIIASTASSMTERANHDNKTNIGAITDTKLTSLDHVATHVARNAFKKLNTIMHHNIKKDQYNGGAKDEDNDTALTVAASNDEPQLEHKNDALGFSNFH